MSGKSELSFKVDAKVYFKHPTKSWVVGRITERNDAAQRYTCQEEGFTEEVPKLTEADVTLCREDLLNEGIEPQVDDLLFLTVLHDATLLRCLQVRYMKDIVYTNIGAIVVALNPFNYKIPWYKDEMMEKYLEEDFVIRKNLPHSWAVAHNTYYEMRTENKPHTILVSGESGAGKTESCKFALKYLGQVSKRCASQEQMDAAEAIRIKIIESSPILEGFGNAKTVRNNNSSRFGKFIRVTFHPNGYLFGADTTSYLLEKSRIITAARGERVYHSFYYLSKGPAAAVLNIKAPQNYKSTSAGQCFDVDDINDVDEFNAVSKAFTIFGMADSEQLNLWKTVAGCLVAQNIDLVAIDKDTTQIAPTVAWAVDAACSHWGIDKSVLAKELLTTTNEVKGEVFTVNLKVAQATDARDSLCKHTYERVFLWIIDRINQSTNAPEDHPSWIGVLDIFGFEDFTVNSFEQLCINLTNETLQNHYNNYIFKKDMEECRAEGVEVTGITCPDNSECLKLISASNGIMGYLDEECRLGTGTDEGFLAKVIQNCSKNPFFYSNPLNRSSFMVRHYAGNVTYTVTGFLDKNRDTLKDALKRLMRTSSNPFVAPLFPDPGDASKGKMTTVGGFFRQQIAELMAVINGTGPHWIRCVKPHPAKKPLMFDGLQVTNQLLSSGVLGTVKIRKAGYPVRMTYANFLARYKILFGRCPPTAPLEEQKVAVRKATKTAEQTEKEVQCGKTRVFMKSEAYFALEKARDEAGIKHRVTLQAAARAIMSQMACRKKVWANSALVIQEEFRMYLKRSEDERTARRIAREKMLAEHTKERANNLNLALTGLRNVSGDEHTEWKELMDLEVKHTKWVENLLLKRIEERNTLVSYESNVRQQIFVEFRDFLTQQTKFRAALYLTSLPEVETSMRSRIEVDQLREFTMICDLFEQVGSTMFRQEVERMERKYRRVIQRLEDLQAMEMMQRMAIFPEFINSVVRAAYPMMPSLQAIKAHAADVQRRATARARISDSNREIDAFSGRRSKDLTMLQKELINIKVGTPVHADMTYRRTGDKVERVTNFASREPWRGPNGVPDIDQVLGGMKVTSPNSKVAVTSSRTGGSASKTSQEVGSARFAEADDDGDVIDMSHLKRTNVFETFRDSLDENNFLRQRHIIAQQFRKLATHQNYDGKFVNETSMMDKKTLQVATELLQKISLEFGEELVKVLRQLNSYCVSRDIPEQHHVTGHWHAYKPVPREMLQTYPPFTNWKLLLAEEKRLEYTIENFKRELLKILKQCEQRGARLPEEVQESSSVDLVHSTYLRLKGHFERCSRCLFPMAPKDTLVHMRLLWPHVTDTQFTDRCRDCQAGFTFGTIDIDPELMRQIAKNVTTRSSASPRGASSPRGLSRKF